MTELFFPEPDRHQEQRGTGRGVLARWLVANGSCVHAGQRLAEVHMAGGWPDQDASWVSALATGTLWHQAKVGEVLTSGSVVGLIE